MTSALSDTAGDTDLSAIGAVLADPARCRVLLALGDGRSLPASVLASEAGVAPSTASTHLARLVDTGLLTVTSKGRFRYFRLAGPEVGELIEAVARLAPTRPVRSLRDGTRAYAVRRARTCYDHLAGRLGVELTDAMRSFDLLAGDGEAAGLTLTPSGRRAWSELGIEVPDADVVRCCIDWTEQRPHIAGPHGRAVLTRLTSLGWINRGRSTRAVDVTAVGRRGFADAFGLEVAS